MIRSLFTLLLLTAPLAQAATDWPRFLGPLQPGHSDSTGLPLKWSETENVKWKTAIPGEGWSSPVVLGDQIWMATAVDEGKSLRGICVDRNTGKVVHDIEIFHVDAPAPKHELNSHASPTPILEPGRAYFSFGMYGSACIDTKTAKPIWKNTRLHHDHDGNGPGSTPIIYQDLYILNCDGTELRYVAALNKYTGELVWRTERSNDMSKDPPPKRKAYSTPLIASINGKDQLLSSGAFRLSSYEPLTGKEIWGVDIPGFSNVPLPVYGNGLVYMCTGFAKAQLWAIKPDGKGVVTASHVAWKNVKGISLKPTPLLVGNELFLVADNGIASCLDSQTGTEIWNERIGGAYSATPLHADGRIYFFSQEGDVIVIKPAKTFEKLEQFKFGSGFMASPAVAGKSLILRSKTHLYRIEK